ncbi:methyltransferase domain-containing protein [Litorivicinus sp.]|nr:methyltransferase domain-containing protein [Litorivicinus sp.]
MQNTKGPWKFNASLAAEFERHISQSIPGYELVHELISVYSANFLNFGSVVIDLGCSSGKVASYLLEDNKGKDITYLGIDNEPEMIRFCTERYSEKSSCSFVCEDIVEYELPQSNLVISVFTLQFMVLGHRRKILEKIFASLAPGGGLILFEKTISDCSKLQDLNSTSLLDVKKRRGLTDAEIINKVFSLRGVMRPQLESVLVDEIKGAGFTQCHPIFKSLGFSGYLAFRD